MYAFVKALITLLSIGVKNKLNDWMKIFIWDQELSQKKRRRSSGVIAAVESRVIRDKCIKKENHTQAGVVACVCDHVLAV